jgi:hypothetical protein
VIDTLTGAGDCKARASLPSPLTLPAVNCDGTTPAATAGTGAAGTAAAGTGAAGTAAAGTGAAGT